MQDQAGPAGGAVVLPSMGVEVRFGASAVSEKMPYPPSSNIVQVNLSNGTTRVVRPLALPGGTDALRAIIEHSLTSKKKQGGQAVHAQLTKSQHVTRAGHLDTGRGRRKDPMCSGGMCCGTMKNAFLYAQRLSPAEMALGDIGETPGHWACAHGNLSALELLEAHGADLAARSTRLNRSVGRSGVVGWSLGWHQGRVDTLIFIARNPSKFEFSAMHYAAATGNVELLTLLLDEGFSADMEFLRGGDLGRAAAFWDVGDDRPVVGEALVHTAAANWQLEILELLYRRGANMNAKDATGITVDRTVAVNRSNPRSSNATMAAIAVGGTTAAYDDVKQFVEDCQWEATAKELRKDSAQAAIAMGLTPNEQLWDAPINARDPESMDSRSGDQRLLGVSSPHDRVARGDDSNQAEWEWMDDDGSWQRYDDLARRLLEGAFSGRSPGVDLGGQHSWYVDFSSMSQKNTASRGATRQVRRLAAEDAATTSCAAGVGLKWDDPREVGSQDAGASMWEKDIVTMFGAERFEEPSPQVRGRYSCRCRYFRRHCGRCRCQCRRRRR